MPHKYNSDRRHHIPKMSFKVQNWPVNEAGLRRRGSLTLWIEDAALDHWKTVEQSSQARCADSDIQELHGFLAPLWQSARFFEGVITHGGAFWVCRG